MAEPFERARLTLHGWNFWLKKQREKGVVKSTDFFKKLKVNNVPDNGMFYRKKWLQSPEIFSKFSKNRFYLKIKSRRALYFSPFLFVLQSLSLMLSNVPLYLLNIRDNIVCRN